MDENQMNPAAVPQTIEEIRAASEARAAAEAAELAEKRACGGRQPPDTHAAAADAIPEKFIQWCAEADELGDGVLFAAIHQGRFVWDADEQAWRVYNGICWEIDALDRHLAGVEDVIEKYLELAAALEARIRQASKAEVPGDQDLERIVQALERRRRALLRAAKRLRRDRGRSAAVRFARTNKTHPLAVVSEAFDRNPMLLGCANEVIDLRLGEPIPARFDQYLSMAAPTEWRGIDCPAPRWERFVAEIFEEREDVIGFFHRLLGYSITGLVGEHVIAVLEGEGGRNGKTTIAETLQHVLGPYCATVQSELLLDSGQTRSAAAPSPEICELRGRRVLFASETERRARIATARVKLLTGGDVLKGRQPYSKRAVSFRPSHHLYLLSNSRPRADANDGPFWERVRRLQFRLTFLKDREPEAPHERRADPNLGEDLKREASGILAWLVRGCLEWQRVGLATPRVVWELTKSYRAEEDFVSEWIEERCSTDDPTAVTKSSILYSDFASWHQENMGTKAPSAVVFSATLRTRFERAKDKKNSRVFKGISLLFNDEEPGYPS